MSMTTPFNPNYTLSNGLKVVVVEPDLGNINEPGYVMTLIVSDEDGDIAVLKQTPNEAEKVIFDVSEILRVTKPSQERHLPSALTNNGSVRRITVQAKEVWDGGDNVIATEVGYVIHGAQQFRDGLLYDEAANRDVFLTEFKDLQAGNDDFGSVAIAPVAVSPSVPDSVQFEVFDSSGSSIQTFDVSLGLVTSSQNTRVQFIALFPNSLATLEFIFLNVNWAYYTATVGSDTIVVHRQCELPYKKYRLAFWNTRGGWDYFNFDLNHREEIQIEREEYTKLFGTWNAADFSFNTYDRGRATFDSATIEQVTVSAKVTQDESEALKKLLGSREVQLLNGSDGEAINIISTSFPIFHNMDRTRKTLTVTFQYANKLLNA